MILFLSRQWLNRLLVGLLVASCWSTAAVHTFFHRQSTNRYMVTLLCDLALDLMSSLGVPIVLVFSYMKDVEPGSPTLFGIKWYEDMWATNAIYEFNIMLVSSLSDLAIQLVFANSMVNTLGTLKQFVSSPVAVDYSADLPKAPKLIRSDLKTGSTTYRMLKASNEEVKGHSAITGSAEEVEERLKGLHRPSVVEILVRHCTAFEMPPIIKSLPLFDTIKMYNITVEEWSEDAAVTTTTQPSFNLIAFIRVNFNDGKIPLGLLSADFPQTMTIAIFFKHKPRRAPE